MICYTRIVKGFDREIVGDGVARKLPQPDSSRRGKAVGTDRN